MQPQQNWEKRWSVFVMTAKFEDFGFAAKDEILADLKFCADFLLATWPND